MEMKRFFDVSLYLFKRFSGSHTSKIPIIRDGTIVAPGPIDFNQYI